MRRPGGSLADVYAWGDRPEILEEIGSRKLATLARWQPELQYEIDLNNPGKHVLAVAFFTPEGVNGTAAIDVVAKDVDRPDGGVLCVYDLTREFCCSISVLPQTVPEARRTYSTAPTARSAGRS